VLVVTADPQLSTEAVEALRLSGVAARAVTGIAQAREAIALSRPDAMVVSQELPGHEFEAFREQAMGRDRCPVIEITDNSPSFHTLGFESWEVAKVGRKELGRELAPAVLFELAKNA
jgi:DNA-binding response OmpR family regulator